MTHPVFIDAAAVIKGNARAYIPLRFGSAADVQAINLSGSYLLFIVNEIFWLDTTDTTSADDGVNVIVDLGGNRWKRYVPPAVLLEQEYTAAGAITIADDEDADVIVINKTVGAATSVALPTAVARTRAITIVDKKGDAATNNITISPKAASGQLIMGGATYVIDSNGASITLRPYADGSGYY